MKFGVERSTEQLSPGVSLTTITKYRNEKPENKMKHYRIRVKVNNAQEEMTEFIRFIEDVTSKRKDNTLTVDRDDPTTLPSFILDYPKDSTTGFIIKCYTVVDN